MTVTRTRTGTGVLPPPPRPAAAVELLERARGELARACRSGSSSERYTRAHLAALRAGAALLAARTVPSGRRRPRSVWEMLPGVAPELTEWAAFFAASGRRRLALERGTVTVPVREADDLVRQADTFLGLVRAALRLPLAEPLPGALTPTGPATVRGSHP